MSKSIQIKISKKSLAISGAVLAIAVILVVL